MSAIRRNEQRKLGAEHKTIKRDSSISGRPRSYRHECSCWRTVPTIPNYPPTQEYVGLCEFFLRREKMSTNESISVTKTQR